jgi:hypothetical protein
MGTFEEVLCEDIKAEVENNLKEWIQTDDFKQRLEREIGMPYEDIIAKLKEKIGDDPQAIERAVSKAFDQVLGR